MTTASVYIDTSDAHPDRGVDIIEVFNAGSSDIPGGALLQITGQTATGEFTVDVPNADSQVGLVVNFPCVIPAGGYGQAHQTFPASVLFETGEGTPSVGDEWGVRAGDCKLHKGQLGYTFLAIGATQYGVVVPTIGGAAGVKAPCRGGLARIVTNICPIMQAVDFGGSVGTLNIQVGQTNEYGLLDTCDGVVTPQGCIPNPTNCCEESGSGSGSVDDGCCPDVPTQLCMSVSCPGACIDGLHLPLVYTPSFPTIATSGGGALFESPAFVSDWICLPGCIDGTVPAGSGVWVMGYLACLGSPSDGYLVALLVRVGPADDCVFLVGASNDSNTQIWAIPSNEGAPVLDFTCSPFALSIDLGTSTWLASDPTIAGHLVLAVSADMSGC